MRFPAAGAAAVRFGEFGLRLGQTDFAQHDRHILTSFERLGIRERCGACVGLKPQGRTKVWPTALDTDVRRYERRESSRGCRKPCPPRRRRSSRVRAAPLVCSSALRAGVLDPAFAGDAARRAASSGEAGCFGLAGLRRFLRDVARRRELIFVRTVIRAPITGVAVEDQSEKRSDVGHEPGEGAQHGRQQGLAG